MSVLDRVQVYVNAFDSYDDATRLTDYPTWISLDGFPSPVCYSNVVIAPEFGVRELTHGAIVEGAYPLDQYAGIHVYDTEAGSSDFAYGLSVGFRGSGFAKADFTSYSMVVNGTDDNIRIWRADPNGSGVSVLMSINQTIQQEDIYYVEVESDGSGGCDISVYNEAGTVLGTTNDPTELVGDMMYTACTYGLIATLPTCLAVEFGYLDREGNRTISNINTDYNVKSLGPMRANGSGLAGVTGGNISHAVAGERPYTITLGEKTDAYVDILPFDIHATQLQYTTLRLTLEHPEGNLEENFTMLPADGFQSVTLSGATGNYMDKDISAVNGDQIEIPTGVQFSLVTLLDNGDAHYDGALNQGQQHERWLFDLSTHTWDDGLVTINQAAVGAAIPVWRSTPAPPNATVGVPYLYNIGYIIDGDRPMTLSQAAGSIPLPNGLHYNSSTYPETIEGTIPSGSGTIVVSGIVTKAENGA